MTRLCEAGDIFHEPVIRGLALLEEDQDEILDGEAIQDTCFHAQFSSVCFGKPVEEAPARVAVVTLCSEEERHENAIKDCGHSKALRLKLKRAIREERERAHVAYCHAWSIPNQKERIQYLKDAGWVWDGICWSHPSDRLRSKDE
jgi:hypothetical protein